MRAIRRCLLTTGALVITFVAVLVTEVMVARGGVHPGAGPPLPADAPAGPPGPPVDTVVWLGDSTGAGIGASGLAGALPEQAAAEIARPIRMTVLARSGDRVADVLHHQLPALAVIRPTVVFITVGANDTTHLTSRGAFRRDYERVLARLPPGVRSRRRPAQDTASRRDRGGRALRSGLSCQHPDGFRLALLLPCRRL